MLKKFVLELVCGMLKEIFLRSCFFLSQFFVTATPAEGHQNATMDFVQLSVTRNKIMTAQYECYQKIMQDPIHKKEGRDCFLMRFY